MANPQVQSSQTDWQAEAARLNKIIRALMDRAERTSAAQSSDFSLLQNTVLLEEQVRSRTAELELAVREIDKTKQALRESEAKFRGLVDQSLIGIVIAENKKYSYSNAKFNEMFGYAAEETRALAVLDIVAERNRPFVAEAMREELSDNATGLKFEFRGLRKSGEEIDIESYIRSMELGGKRAIIGVFMDVTDRVAAERQAKALQEKLRDLSTHDALTGLFNRRYLEDTLKRELILAKRDEVPLSLIMVDIDHFKVINDRFGHQAGDKVLHFLGDLLNHSVRGNDTCCRYGGEEFLVVLLGMDEDGAVERAECLRKAVAISVIDFGATTISVTASFGVATFPHDGETADELIAVADSALYAAKAAGRNRVNVNAASVRL
jgi:diguanylate cyclase (GGDEF)-like protein/PAS domain S-box-containing protein